jgi:hypothetical protein
MLQRRRRSLCGVCADARCERSATRLLCGRVDGADYSLLFSVSFAAAESLRTATAPTPITVEATPIASFDTRDAQRTRFGALAFRGGLVLGSKYQAFGRNSGLQMQPDGAPLADRGWFDMESLAQRNGVFYVGIERVEKIVRSEMRREGLAAHGQPIQVPADFKTFKFNKSLECLAVPPKGAPLGIPSPSLSCVSRNDGT